jgi:hypothetical protein
MVYRKPAEGYTRWHIDIDRDVARRANARYIEIGVSRPEYLELALEELNKKPIEEVRQMLGVEYREPEPYIASEQPEVKAVEAEQEPTHEAPSEEAMPEPQEGESKKGKRKGKA